MGPRDNTGRYRKLGDRYAKYDVYDRNGDKVGTVDTTYVNEETQQEYVGVSGGLSRLIPGTSSMPGTSSSLVPVDICTVDNNRKTIEVPADKDTIENSPSLSSGADITPEYEAQIRGYYRL